MNVRSAAVAHVLSVPPYQAGTPISSVAREFGIDPISIVKLASNENPFGMSPLAHQEWANFLDGPARYPDPDCYDLRYAIAAKHDISPDSVIVGAGATELIWLAARAFVAERRAAIIPQYAFTLYDTATRAVGGRSIIIPDKQYGHDLELMLAAIAHDVTMIYVASPNNPTGTILDALELEQFFDRIPNHILIVLDEAYREYMAHELRPDVGRLLSRYSNLLVLRTFSKIYGLAGLRVGYALAKPEIIEVLQRLRSPFSVNTVAQAAAKSALSDEEFVEKCFRVNRDEIARVSTALGDRGFAYIPSHANFLLVQVGNGAAVYHSLLTRGVIVRPMASWALPNWVRVTIGLPAENTIFLAALSDVSPSGSPV